MLYPHVAGTLQSNYESQKYPHTYALQPQNAHASKGALAILMRIIAKLKASFAKTKMPLRLESGFVNRDLARLKMQDGE